MDGTTSRSTSLAMRTLWTLLLPLLLLWGSETVFLSGIDANVLLRLDHRFPFLEHADARNLSVFALGVTPIIAGYALVELVALLVPRLQRLRHDNPKGRAKLELAARALGLAFAAAQGFGVAVSLKTLGKNPLSPEIATASLPVVTVTLVGGVCIALLVADVITRQGIANGIVLLVAVDGITSIVSSVATRARETITLGTFALRDPFALVVEVGVPAVITWLALRGANRVGVTQGGSRATPYRDARAFAVRPWVPVPSSSLAPYVIAPSIMILPATLALFLPSVGDALRELDRSSLAVTVIRAALVFLLVLVLTRMLHRPVEMAGLASRLGLSSEAEARKGAHDARRAALVPTLLFFTALLLTSHIAGALYHALTIGASIVLIPQLVACCMDMLDGFRAARRGLVAVWADRRASAVPVLRAALEEHGIEVTIHGIAVLSLFQYFAPYAPARILVKAEDAPRATAILEHLVLGKDAPPEDSATTIPLAARETGPSMKSRTIAMAAVTGVAAAALGIAVFASLGPRIVVEEAVPRSKLEVFLVDDESLGAVETVFPDDFHALNERVPVSVGRQMDVTFVALDLRRGESLDAAIARGDEWAKTTRLPAGERIRWGILSTFDPETTKETVTGARTYVIKDPPILSTEDIVDATQVMDTFGGTPTVSVRVTLSEGASTRFSDATAANVGRRMAIVFDDRVDSAPVVKSRIAGGIISVTMGAGDLDEQVAKARALVAGLRGVGARR